MLYGGSRALAGLLALITFPFVARILTPEELGQFAIIQMLTLFLVPLAAAGQDTSVMKFLSGDEDRSGASVNVTALALQSLGIMAVLLVTCAVATTSVADISEIFGWDLFLLSLVGVPAGVLFSTALNLSKFKFRRGAFLLVSILQVGLYTTFLVCSVILLRYGVYGYTLSTAGSLLLASFVGLYLLRDQFSGGTPSRKLASSMLRFGAPYALVGLLTVSLPLMDRLVLSLRASAADIGIYSVAIRYASLLEMVVVGFKMAWWPVAFSAYKADRDDDLFGRALGAYTVAAGCFVVFMYTVSETGIRVIAGETYLGAIAYVLPLLLAVLLRGAQVVVGVGIAISGRSMWAPVGLCAGIATGLVVALLLWPSLGIVSVAWGVLAGEAVALLATTAISQRFLPLRWRFGRTLILVVALCAYLWAAEIGFVAASPAQGAIFSLVYCAAGWFVLRSKT